MFISPSQHSQSLSGEGLQPDLIPSKAEHYLEACNICCHPEKQGTNLPLCLLTAWERMNLFLFPKIPCSSLGLSMLVKKLPLPSERSMFLLRFLLVHVEKTVEIIQGFSLEFQNLQNVRLQNEGTGHSTLLALVLFCCPKSAFCPPQKQWKILHGCSRGSPCQGLV